MAAYLKKKLEASEAEATAQPTSKHAKARLARAEEAEAAALSSEKHHLARIAKEEGKAEELDLASEIVPEFNAEHMKAALELRENKPPTVYTKFDYEHAKPEKGYYFPSFPPKPSRSEERV